MTTETDSEEETMIYIPAIEFAGFLEIANSALMELRNHKEKGVRIEDDMIYGLIQEMGDNKSLHHILFTEDEPEPTCCLTCGSCDGCNCEEIQEADALVAYA